MPHIRRRRVKGARTGKRRERIVSLVVLFLARKTFVISNGIFDSSRCYLKVEWGQHYSKTSGPDFHSTHVMPGSVGSVFNSRFSPLVFSSPFVFQADSPKRR